MSPVKIHKIVSAVLLLFGLSIFLAGCPSEEPKSELVKKQQIGVIVSDGRDLNTQIIKKTMDRRLKKDKVQLIWLDSENDAAKEQENASALLKRKVDVVVLQPVEETGAASLVGQLKQEKIKVITLGKMPPNTPLDGHISPDYSCAGDLQAQFVLNTLAQGRTPSGNIGDSTQEGQNNGEKGASQGGSTEQQGSRERPLNSTVLLLRGPQEDRVSAEASAASLSVLATNSSVGVKVREIPIGDTAQIDSKTLEYLTESSEMPGFVLTNEPQVGESVLKYLLQEGRDNQVITVGLGGGRDTAMALAGGRHNAEVDTMPEVVANQICDAAIAMSEGEHWSYDRLVNNGDYQVPLRLTPVRLILPENAFLLEERWGSLKDPAAKIGQENPSEEKKQGGTGSQSSGGSSQGSQGGMTTTVTIKTAEGKTYEMKIDGTVQSIESKQEGASQGEGGGQGQGGSGGSGGKSATVGG